MTKLGIAAVLALSAMNALAPLGGAHAQVASTQTAAPSLTDDFLPKQAGMVVVRVRAIGVIPETTSSSVSLIGGHVGVTATPAPEVDFSYFLTDHIAAELIAASTRHEVAASGTILGHVDVGSVYVLPPTLTAQYHFFPKSRFSPYIGVGVTAAFFYDSQPAEPTVTKVGLSNAVGPAIQAGFDYSLGGPWALNFDVKQIFVNTEARINGGVIVAKTALDPTVVGAGIEYRF
jgi:outer membrane protein